MGKNEMRGKKREEALMKKIAVQQSLIESAEKNIFENITQCLCLARLQLGCIDLSDRKKSMAVIGEANLLIGKAVKDLRTLVKNLSQNI